MQVEGRIRTLSGGPGDRRRGALGFQRSLWESLCLSWLHGQPSIFHESGPWFPPSCISVWDRSCCSALFQGQGTWPPRLTGGGKAELRKPHPAACGLASTGRDSFCCLCCKPESWPHSEGPRVCCASSHPCSLPPEQTTQPAGSEAGPPCRHLCEPWDSVFQHIFYTLGAWFLLQISAEVSCRAPAQPPSK